ncbi:MAG: MBOAT family protein [Oscillospiraceae bacterium]|nr:MBOAT family protein [Oscillospiraceae bacterium]
MLFSSIPFLYYFLPAVILLYLIAPKGLKNAVLLAFSLLFYAWGEKKLVLLFAFAILFGWVTGLILERVRGSRWAKPLLFLSVAADLGLLGYFKYSDFFLSSVNGALGLALPLTGVALPIGISFYTFQLLSYKIDVYRGSVPAQKNPVDFGAYVSMFPQLIAGPIVRYADIAEQLAHRSHTLERIASGIRRFLIGLGKKVLFANTFGALCAQFRATTEPSVLFYWLYAVSFLLQIYFDFSGYSDMAIGLGRLFGFDFMENFQHPYISASITEFWRRWHISLGSWFRDYVYIPLGGNRRGKSRQLLNILVVWMLTGLWHGAAWNFVLWGLFYAVLLTTEKLWTKQWLDQHKAVGHIYVLFTVMLGFVLFNADSLPQAASDIAGLFAFGRLPLLSQEALYCLRSFGVTLLLGMVGATPLPALLAKRMAEHPKTKTVVQMVEPFFWAGILLLSTAYLVDGSFNPFLYFRF